MNAIIVMVLCVAALGTGSAYETTPEPPMFGGRDALPGEVPWIVSLSSDLSNNNHYCSGSILDSTHILTSAHCVYGIDPKAAHLTAWPGRLDNPVSLYNVIKATPHPNYQYRYQYYAYDVAILCTDEEIVFNSNISSVQLPSEPSALDPDTIILVAGWGKSAGLSTLEVMDVPILDGEVCQRTYPYNNPDKALICAGVDGKGVCVGDEGGPLTKDGVQYGIMSEVSPRCYEGISAFTDVNHYLDWIKDNMKTKCLDAVAY